MPLTISAGRRRNRRHRIRRSAKVAKSGAVPLPVDTRARCEVIGCGRRAAIETTPEAICDSAVLALPASAAGLRNPPRKERVPEVSTHRRGRAYLCAWHSEPLCCLSVGYEDRPGADSNKAMPLPLASQEQCRVRGCGRVAAVAANVAAIEHRVAWRECRPLPELSADRRGRTYLCAAHADHVKPVDHLSRTPGLPRRGER